MKAPASILLVEDDESLGFLIQDNLELQGYRVRRCRNGEEGGLAFGEGGWDLVVLDVMMPKKDGFTLGKEIREQYKDIPIIFLTAKTLKDDKIQGFQVGADDYITKPFDSEELLYRIQAVLKRSKHDPQEEPEEFVIGSYHFNFPLRILNRNGDKAKLSPKEAALLKMFCMRINNILPRSEALTKIWGEDNYFTARSMDVFVTKLRKYLKGDENIEIVNIHGNGFQLKVREATEV